MNFRIKNAYYRLIQKISSPFISKLGKQKSELIIGPGSSKEIYKLLQKVGVHKPLIVTDKNLTRIGLYKPMIQAFRENDIKYVLFDDVLPNPTIKMVDNAKKIFLENKCDCMVGFGGGSAMDCGKLALALITKQLDSASEFKTFFFSKENPPVYIAVPTTSGTGSETSMGAVVTNPEGHEKKVIMSSCLLPKYAVLDPELTLGLPPYITATTGMDALTHAVEAYISNIGDKTSDDNAIQAIQIVFNNLMNLYENGNQLDLREQMAHAAYLAGLAMSGGLLGYVHSIAHKLGGLYNIPHGLANAVILPYILEFYGEKIYPKLSKLAIATEIGDKNEPEKALANKFIQAIRDINAKMYIPSSIKEMRLEDIDVIAKAALDEGNPLYHVPIIMNLEEMRSVVKRLMLPK